MEDGLSSPSVESLPYRPRLDGLRGLAVLLVLGFHANLVTLPGGFLGIDLFFVLSGFLITSLLVAYFVPTGSMGFRRFWTRRFRRLVPALLLVVMAVALATIAFPTDPAVAALRNDGLSVVGFVSNWRFVATGQSYFSSFSPSVLLHTWSLGVEEQWYLLWPLVLLGLLHLTKGRTGALFAIAMGGAAASAGWMAYLTSNGTDLSRAYYGTDTRAQALLVGSALAFALWNRREASLLLSRVLTVVGALSLAGLLAMAATVRDQDLWMYHGGFLLAAVLSAGVVAMAARTSRGPVAMLLNAGWLRYVGRISYGLYLWHWPIDVLLTPARMGFGGVPLKLVQFGLALLAAGLSSVLLELPIRTGTRAPRRPVMVSLASIGIAVVMVLVVSVTSVAPNLPAASAGTFSSPAAAPHSQQILVVGDSVAWSLSTGVPASAHRQVQTVWRVQCDVVGDEIFIGHQVDQAMAGCSQWPGEWAAAAAHHPDVIVVVLGLRQLFDPRVDGQRLTVGSKAWQAYYRTRLTAAIGVLRGQSSAPIVFLGVPCFTWATHPEAGEAGDPRRISAVNHALWAVAASSSKVTVVDYGAQVCTGLGGGHNIVALRPDGAHLTTAAARKIWGWLAPQLPSASASGRGPGG